MLLMTILNMFVFRPEMQVSISGSFISDTACERNPANISVFPGR